MKTYFEETQGQAKKVGQNSEDLLSVMHQQDKAPVQLFDLK